MAKITNIVPNGDEINVFFELSNGEVNTKTFPIGAQVDVSEILSWGEGREQFFRDREIELERIRQEVINIPEEVIPEEQL